MSAGSTRSVSRPLSSPCPPADAQLPVKSGLPSAVRGGGAVILTLPSGVRGSPGVLWSNHCAPAGNAHSISNTKPIALIRAQLSRTPELPSILQPRDDVYDVPVGF